MTAEVTLSAGMPALDTLDTQTQELAVSSYLEKARSWLATAVEMTGPEQIAAVKAEIATAAEATKQLHLSKEIQMDALEMVRRAEYALGKAIRKGQHEGTIATEFDIKSYAGRRRQHGDDTPVLDKARPSRFASQDDLTSNGAGIYHLTDGVEPEQFESAITEAKTEGNLSRANVVRKTKQRQDGPPTPTRRGGNRKKHLAVLESMNTNLSGLVIALREITELDCTVTSEEAARIRGDLSEQISVLNNIRKLLKERTA